MKQNITLAIEQRLLKRARAIAAQRGTSVSGLLTKELEKLVDREGAYAKAKTKALSYLHTPFHLGGTRISSREQLHERPEDEAKKVRRALKQVREGKTTPWSRVKDDLGL
jgi:alkylated DNA nucleotide flippase Atl1